MIKFILIFLLLTAQVKADSTPLIKHILVSAFSDIADATLVQPSDWNDYHYLDVGKTMFIKDEFVGGALTTGDIGERGWNASAASGTVMGVVVGVTNHPGVDSIQTSTSASSTVQGLELSGNTNFGNISPNSFFDLTFKVKLCQTNDTTVARVGLLYRLTNSGNNAQPSDGVWFEKDSNETSWFGELRASSVSTRTAALVAQSTNFVSLRVRRKDYDIDSIAYSVDGGTEVSLPTSTNMSSLPLVPVIQIGNNNKTKTRAILIDYFSMLVVNMSR